jgi:hypothetical protein
MPARGGDIAVSEDVGSGSVLVMGHDGGDRVMNSGILSVADPYEGIVLDVGSLAAEIMVGGGTLSEGGDAIGKICAATSV